MTTETETTETTVEPGPDMAAAAAVELAQRKAEARAAAEATAATVRETVSRAAANHAALVARRAEVARHQADRYLPIVESMVQTAGLPAMWVRILGVGAPILGHVAAGIVTGLSADSPGGKKLTRAEVEDLVDAATEELRSRLLGELVSL